MHLQTSLGSRLRLCGKDFNYVFWKYSLIRSIIHLFFYQHDFYSFIDIFTADFWSGWMDVCVCVCVCVCVYFKLDWECLSCFTSLLLILMNDLQHTDTSFSLLKNLRKWIFNFIKHPFAHILKFFFFFWPSLMACRILVP